MSLTVKNTGREGHGSEHVKSPLDTLVPHVGEMFRVPDPLLQSLLPANGTGNVAGDGPSPWVLAIYLEAPVSVSGSRLPPGTTQTVAA